jgi:hypothetical protein
LSESQILISPASIPEHDVLHSAIQLPGTPLSMLGIDLMKRNRHHINGATTISECDATGLHFQVWDYSPSCLKYINRHEIIPSAMPMNEAAIREECTILTESDRDFVQSIDTLWIESYVPNVRSHHWYSGLVWTRTMHEWQLAIRWR